MFVSRYITTVIILVGLVVGSVSVVSSVRADDSSAVSINEIMYNPDGTDTGREWVELYNRGSEDISIATGAGVGSWRFFDGQSHYFNNDVAPSTTLAAGGYLVLSASPDKFRADYPDFTGTVWKVALMLSDSDTLRLSADKGENWFSEVNYTSALGGKNSGKTLERDPLTDAWRESYVLGGTPGRANSSEGDRPVWSSEIKISEILPRRASDGRDEFIELYNRGSAAVDLGGWRLDDAEGGSSPYLIPASRAGGAIIAAGGYMVFEKAETKIALNDGGDEIRLFNPDGAMTDQVVFEKAPSNSSYSKIGDGFVWTTTLSPAAQNALTPLPVVSSSPLSTVSAATSAVPTSAKQATVSGSATPTATPAKEASASNKKTPVSSPSTSKSKAVTIATGSPLPAVVETASLPTAPTAKFLGVQTQKPFAKPVDFTIMLSAFLLILLGTEWILQRGQLIFSKRKNLPEASLPRSRAGK